MNQKLQKVLTVILAVILVALLGCGIYNIVQKNKAKKAAETTETQQDIATETTQQAATPPAVAEAAEEADDVTDLNEDGAATVPIDAEDTATEDETPTTPAGARPEGATETGEGYISDVTAEDVAAFNAAFPALSAGTANKIIANYNSQFNYEQWPDGTYKIPFSWNSMTENDFARQKSAVWRKFSKREINDASDFIFENLEDEDISALLKLTFGQSIDLKSKEQLKLELFQTWLENPVLFEEWLAFLQDLKVGESGTLAENCPGLRNYLSENQAARQNGGPGLMIRLRDETGNTGMAITDVDNLYVNQSHIMAVCQLISFIEPLELGAGRYHVSRRYHLVGFDYNHLRVATETKEDEPDLDYWLTFSYYLKGGKRAFFIGANLADRSPGEITNTSVGKKGQVVDNVTPVRIDKKYNIIPGTKTGGGPTPDPNPNPPGPNPKPKTEHKSPSKDPANQGNAPIGGGKNDNPGPGTQKPDLGNSKSPEVPDSQYQPGNSENPDGGNNNPSGPPADYTDGGEAPKTDPISEHPSNNTGDTGEHNKPMDEPPAPSD